MEKRRYIDTHAHFPLLVHDTAEKIMQRARDAGLYRAVTVATEEKNFQSTADLAQKVDWIYFALGVHPHEAKDWPTQKIALEKFFAAGTPQKCVAIGETGLDFHYNLSPHEAQIVALTDHINLAKKHSLPLILHCRNSFKELYSTLRTTGMSAAGGVMHCFTGSLAEAKEALDLGLMLSFSGIVTFKTAEELRAVAKFVPRQRYLVETDCPFLAPVPLRGQANEPSFLPHTVRTIAAARSESEDVVAAQTTHNALEFFKLPG